MRFYGSLDELILYSVPAGKDETQIDGSTSTRDLGLEQILEDKVATLSILLSDIAQTIVSRYKLSYLFITQLYEHYCYLKSKLFELYIWPLSGNRAIEQRRSNLEKQLDALKQEKRKEDVSRWQDVAQLRKERREWLKQYRDLASRVRFIVEDRT